MVQAILAGFRSFQVVPCFRKYMDVLVKKFGLAGVYSQNSVGRGRLRK